MNSYGVEFSIAGGVEEIVREPKSHTLGVPLYRGSSLKPNAA